MNPVVAYLKSHGGYGSMRGMKSASIQPREIARLLENGTIEKIKPGLYRLAKRLTAGPIRDTLIDACEAMPRGVICLLSALDYHDLTSFNPSEVYIAIPHSDKPPKISYPPVRTFFFRDRFYSPGILSVRTPNGYVRVYNMEKTVCDMFRYRRKLGENLAIEGLKTYLARKDANLTSLRKYADLCQVKTTLIPYLKAIVT